MVDSEEKWNFAWGFGGSIFIYFVFCTSTNSPRKSFTMYFMSGKRPWPFINHYFPSTTITVLFCFLEKDYFLLYIHRIYVYSFKFCTPHCASADLLCTYRKAFIMKEMCWIHLCGTCSCKCSLLSLVVWICTLQNVANVINIVI